MFREVFSCEGYREQRPLKDTLLERMVRQSMQRTFLLALYVLIALNCAKI